MAAENVVAASQPLAAQAGLSMMARGGNAVDAAIATAITLTLVEPTGNGIGSDAFAIIWDGTQLHGLNASGRSPAAWTSERFKEAGKVPFRGWESVTVPGAVSSWVACSERFGRLPFETLFEPAIRYAEDGFPVSTVIAHLWARAAVELRDQPGFADAFLPGGAAPAAGKFFRSPGHAKTLRAIAETKGRDFYEGALAREIAAFAKAHGAALSYEDLASHTPEWCGTISKPFGPLELHEIPPNGQGIAALMALGILAHTPIQDLDVDDPLALHFQIEAMKLALRDAEHFVADIDHMQEVTPDALLDEAYLRARAQEISPDVAKNVGAGAPKHGGTVCLSTADADGMMVSFIQSNYAGFGSGVVVPGTGIALQNRGAGFSWIRRGKMWLGPANARFTRSSLGS